MNKIHNILLFFLLVLLLALYFFWNKTQKKSDIKIEPIRIAPIQIEKQNISAKVSSQSILSQFKKAVEASQENLASNIENKYNQIIINLQHTIQQQEINRSKLETKIVKKKVTVPKTIIKKRVTKKAVIKKTVIKRPIIKKVTHRVKQKKKLLPKPKIRKEPSNKPLEFVKTLGIVKVSNAYESSFSVPKKVEVAKEGIVNMPTASVATKELKALEPVQTLGVVKVSKDFETTQAKAYLEE